MKVELPAELAASIVHKTIGVEDNDWSDLLSRFDATFAFIDQARSSGCILVHCEQGLSRSATVVVAYLMKKNSWPVHKALAFLQENRPAVKPNPGFMIQLNYFEKAGFTLRGDTEVHKLLAQFPDGRNLRMKELLAHTRASAVKLRSDSVVENVIYITLDGVRQHEMFFGLDETLVKHYELGEMSTKKLEDTALYKLYGAPTPAESRAKIWKFLWGDFLKSKAAILGNRAKKDLARLSNRHRISFPGYSEMFVGIAHDDTINSNDVAQNPNSTVLEFIKRELDLEKHQIAAFGSWGPLQEVVERYKGTITANAGVEIYRPPKVGVMTASDRAHIELLNRLQFETPLPHHRLRHDSLTFQFAIHHLKTYKPKVLYLGLSESDDWAHDQRYDLVLQSLVTYDKYIAEIVKFVESDPQYAGKTAILISTDHGRGETVRNWCDHNIGAEGSQYVWMACMAPHLQHRGEIVDSVSVEELRAKGWPAESGNSATTAQIASTLAGFLGLNYLKENSEAAPPISVFM